MMIPNETDVLIIGAGPAGSMAAALLHREGFRLQIVEKQTFPRFVIGESLLPSSMALLDAAGFLETIEEQGFMRKFGAVFLRGNESCNFDFANQSTTGWKYTYQVTRADFDKALADNVAARGVPIHYGHAVTAVDFEGDAAVVTIEKPDRSKQMVTAKFVLDCSGYGRVLPRLLDLEEPSTFPPREAIFTHITGDRRPTDREEGKIWVCIHPGGAWIWIIPFANGKSSVGVVGDPEFFRKFPEEPEAQLRAIIETDPNAAARLADMQIVFPPARINGFACSVKKLYGPRFALVGNATEFLDPVFSSGVALALESAQRAAEVLTRQLRGQAVDWETDYAEFMRHGINTFRAYVTAWYNENLQQIFFASQRDPAIMRQICSVLAGYVWDKENPYVTQADRALGLLANIARRQKQPA
jgi:2-polyprenyl-6-methoxyphenol hydroxylase-like FAD-dependent oxidoreductase